MINPSEEVIEEGFVIMQFSNPELERLWTDVYFPVLKDCGLAPRRVDKHSEGKLLQSEIADFIHRSKIIIADLTCERPNCYLEVGYAMGIGKFSNLILCARADHHHDHPSYTKGGPRIHFDLSSYNFLWWDFDKIQKFKSELKKAIDHRLKLLKKTGNEQIVPTTQSSALDLLKKALVGGASKISPLCEGVLDLVHAGLLANAPQFSNDQEPDETILAQIQKGIPNTKVFIELANQISRYNNKEAVEITYRFFGKVLSLYYGAEDTSLYHNEQSDGYKFLGYEMFVSFIRTLINYDHWDILGELLSADLFVETKSRYGNYVQLSSHIQLIDAYRKRRLQSSRISITSDILKERFEKQDFGFTHYQFMEADYFLFLRSVSQERDSDSLFDTWCPTSCIYLNKVPSYMIKCESRRFLLGFSKALGFILPDSLGSTVQKKHSWFRRFFPSSIVHSPLDDYDFSKIGTRP